MRTLIGFKRVVFAAVAAMGVNAWALTASSYKGAENMINQWDAIENVNPLDLDGEPRLDRKGRVGLGCYAGFLDGFLLLVK